LSSFTGEGLILEATVDSAGEGDFELPLDDGYYDYSSR